MTTKAKLVITAFSVTNDNNLKLQEDISRSMNLYQLLPYLLNYKIHISKFIKIKRFYCIKVQLKNIQIN